jgi:hypothetical protein
MGALFTNEADIAITDKRPQFGSMPGRFFDRMVTDFA